MSVKETLTFDGREVYLEWFELADYPKDISISQVVGFCVNKDGEVLIIKNQRGWGFPGGHPESGETPEETLRREVAEEAYVTIKNQRLLGYIEVSDPDNQSVEGKHYIQLRYFAELDEVLDFNKEFETSERAFVVAEQLPQYIKWLSSPTGSAQYKTFSDSLKNK